VVILFIRKTSKSNGLYRKLRDVLLFSIVFLIITSQSFIVVITDGQSIEIPNEQIVNYDFKDHINFFCFVKIDLCCIYFHSLPLVLLNFVEFLEKLCVLPQISDFIFALTVTLVDLGMINPIIIPHMVTLIGMNSKSATVHTYGLFGYRSLKRQTNLYPTAFLIGFTGFKQINVYNGDISMIGWALCCYVK